MALFWSCIIDVYRNQVGVNSFPNCNAYDLKLNYSKYIPANFVGYMPNSWILLRIIKVRLVRTHFAVLISFKFLRF